MRFQRGFTITEIMVAVAIGLIGTLIVFKSLDNSNSVSRNVTGGSDAQTTGTLALYSIERDVRQAGYGINDPAILGCQLRLSNATAGFTLPADVTGNTAVLTPLQIRTDADGNPILRVAYAGGRSVSGTKLVQAFPGSDASILRVANVYGMRRSGTMLLVTEGNTMEAENWLPGLRICSVYQTSSDLADDTTPPSISRSSVSPFSPSSAYSGVTYSLNAKVFNLGQGNISGNTALDTLQDTANMPVWKEYRVNRANQTLEERDLLRGETEYKVIAPNVVDMYLDYVQRDGTFRTTSPVDAGGSDVAAYQTFRREWQDIIGVRISLLARDPNPDFSKGVACRNAEASVIADTTKMITASTSRSLETGFPGVEPFQLSLDSNTDAHCYRYKTHSTIITMRNAAWM